MLITDFAPFKGQHCETTATGSLLKHLGLELSEPMLFGVGEGLGFIYWDMRTMPFPFLGGRIKPQQITKNLATNSHLRVNFQETSSVQTAWKNVQTCIDAGIPVGIQLDAYYLEYFTQKIHFAGHFVAMYGYDETYAYLVDTQPTGGTVKATLKNVERARNAKGSMSAKNLSYTIVRTTAMPNLAEVVMPAIRHNAEDFLIPPISNLGYKGIEKASKQVKAWFTRSRNIRDDLALAAALMEGGGTGGALFRNMYRDFLGQCAEFIDDPNLVVGHEMFCRIAPQWTEAARLIKQAGETIDQSFLNQASAILLDLSKQEKEAMGYLAHISAPAGKADTNLPLLAT
jgi:hypothetical protein